MATVKRKCDNCEKHYEADIRNLKRGWGKCCSKSCAASKREKQKPGYNTATVSANNERRKNWNNTYYKKENWEHDDDQGWDAHKDSF